METIKSSTEISFLFSQGKRYNLSSISLLVYRRNRQHDLNGRVAFIAGKKQGNAVWRNKAKRRMRAVSREIEDCFQGYDVVFIAKQATTKVVYSKLLDDSKKLTNRFMSDCDL